MAITATQRTDIVKATVAMFGAAPGGYMAELTAMYEAYGSNITAFMTALGETTAFQSQAAYTNFKTNAEKAVSMAAAYGLTDTTTAGSAGKQAYDYFLSELNAGTKIGAIFAAANNFLATTTDTAFDTAKNTLNNKTTVAEYYTVTMAGTSTTIATLQSTISGVTATTDVTDPATIIANSAAAVTGQTYTLTTGMDTIAGTTGNDTINATIDGTTGAVTTTMTTLDSINGGAGADVLNINVLNGADVAGTAVTAFPTVSVSGVETVNVRAAVTTTGDVSGYTGLTALNVTQAASDITMTAASTTNVNTSGTAGTITVKGGNNVAVTDATDAKAITVSNGGATGNAVGTITVTDSKQGNAAIVVDGGTTVNVTATSTGTSGNITVGGNKAASGAVVVTQNITSDNSAAVTAGDITVTGGSTVTVNVNTTNTASKDSSGVNDITAGTVTVNGDSKTTSVTINQNNVANDYASETTGASKETAVVTFSTLKSGEKAIISVGALTGAGTDLTFTAAKDLTAAEVAAAFANLTNADIQACGGKVANGTFTGTLDSGFTSGAVSGSTVTFTSTTNTNATNIVVSAKQSDGTTNTTNVASFTVTTTDGSAGTSTTARDLTAANANVVVDDNATAAITDVTIKGYGTADVGTNTALTKLANISLANSGGQATIDAAAGITSLNMTVDNVKHAVDVSTNSTTVATLNLTTANADSAFALTAAQVKNLNVSGAKLANLTGSSMAALETVVVTGTAGLNLGAVVASKSITTTGTTGAVTATIDGTAATYTGGAGVDTVTLATGTALTKAIDLGEGDDTVVFSAAVTGSTAALSGGAGTDTLSMTNANADSLDNSVQSFYTNFERLTINNAYGTDDASATTLTLNLANLGFTNYVKTSGTVYGTGGNAGVDDILVLDKMAGNATVVLTAKGLITAQLADATGSTDVVNVIANVTTAGVDFGTFTANSIETINISASDTTLDNNSDGTNDAVDTTTLALSADTATTINVTGNANVTLGTLTNAAKVATIDASASTGALNVTSANTTTAVTIKGGSAADTLVASNTSTQAQTIYGNGGNDAITAGKGMDKLYGGDGADTFNITVASVNVNSAATIMDLAAGDVIKFGGTIASFKSAGITLDTTAVFQDYANAAVIGNATNDLSWFQYSGNTYIVKDIDASTSAFVNNSDMIVKISGLVDLSTATFNATSGTLEIC